MSSKKFYTHLIIKKSCKTHNPLMVRCTPKKLTMLTKHSKTFFSNHIVNNIFNYHPQKLYLKKASKKGSDYAFATWCHSALQYL